MSIILVLLGILILLRLVIGVQLFFNAQRNNLPNLYWLSVLFLLNFVGLSFIPIEGNPLGSLSVSVWINNGFGLLSGLMLIEFIRTTFYVNRPSPHRWFIGIHLVLSVMALYGLADSKSFTELDPLVAGFTTSTTILWAWHAIISYQSFATIQNNENVEDWVKGRYQWMIAYAIIASISSFISVVRIGFAGNSESLITILGVLALLANIFTIIPQLLVWSMPESFRNWLNRNQKANVEERTHKQAQAVLNILGATMSAETGLSSMMAVFSIRKTIGMEIKSEDTSQIDARIIGMGFDEWIATLRNPELYILIKNSGLNINAVDVIDKAKQALIEKQSLFTMQAK